MKLIETVNAVGHILCHDITQIVPGVVKDAAFRKGHIVTADDIPVLLSLGKDHLYVWEHTPGTLHENEAAERLAALCRGQGIRQSEVKEGKIELMADREGLFRVDTERLLAVNSQDEVMIATRHSMGPVKAGDKLAGTRVIPLVIDEAVLARAEEAAGDQPLMEVLPWVRRTAAIITTGNEVFHGRIQDKFTPVVAGKLAKFGVEVIHHALSDDQTDHIISAIEAARLAKPDLILCTGGMSVDPDDRTPGAIKAAGARVVSYGAPVLPGAMFLMGYFADGTPVMGLPGCVMYAGATVFDLILPRVLADVPVTRHDLAVLGHGGLCLGCADCTFPHCPFGR